MRFLPFPLLSLFLSFVRPSVRPSFLLSFFLPTFLPSLPFFFKSVFEAGSYNTAQMVLNSLFSFLLSRDYWCGPPHPALSSIFNRSQAAASGTTENTHTHTQPPGFTADTRRKKANSSSLWLPKGKTTSEAPGSPSCSCPLHWTCR